MHHIDVESNEYAPPRAAIRSLENSLSCSYPNSCNLSPLSLVLLDRTDERNQPIDTESTLHTLFTQYGQAIGRYLTRLTGDPSRAEELSQETFVRAYLALEQGAQWDTPRAWLYRVASRLAINDYRRRKLIRWLPLWDADTETTPGVEATVAEQLAVREALAALPPRYRVPLVLYTAEGYSVAEVADILELSTGAVKVRLYRAREKFRRAYRLQEQGVPGGASVTAVGFERGSNE